MSPKPTRAFPCVKRGTVACRWGAEMPVHPAIPGLLETLYRRYHRPEMLPPDPLVFVRRFGSPDDGEVAGLLAASLAYGRVDAIMGALGRVFGRLGPAPRKALETTPPREWVDRFEGFRYRFHRGQDLALLCVLVARALERYGGLARLFVQVDPGGDIRGALCGFAEAILGQDPRPVLPGRRVPDRHPVRHLLASPRRGGAAKRLCLFLRWMVRKDALDPGFWQGRVDPARLVVPLDVHVARAGRALGFTRRKSTDWRTAQEITGALRRYDPADPLRYEFSLFRFGMKEIGPSGTPARRR